MRPVILALTASGIASISVAAEPSLLKPDAHQLAVFDPRVIHTAQNARLVPGVPVKAAENPLFSADKPWENALNNLYPNVLWDESEKVFKLWYKCVLSDNEAIAKMDGPSTVHEVGWYLLYATSKDGIRWDKPKLGLHKFDGSADTNIVARDCPNAGVLKDGHETDPARRYKMVSDVGLGKPQVRFSPDGIHWGAAVDVKGFGPQNGDTHNNALWDERTGKFLWFTKLYLGERTMARFESDDFLNWRGGGMVLRSSIAEGRATQTYCMTPFRWGRVWLAWVMMYHPGAGRTVDCELAWSPDSIKWERLMPGTPFIPRGGKGCCDSECIYAMAGPPIVQDGQHLIFYGGDDFPHTGWKRDCVPCLARLPLDHFAGYAPADKAKPATIFTTKLRVTGEPLRITADGAGGRIRIAALDDIAVGIDEAEPITADVTSFEVKWKGRGLAAHGGRDVHLQFELTNATLWSISGLDPADETMPEKISPLKNPHRRAAPVAARAFTFDADVEKWTGVDQVTHHPDGGAKGGHVTVSRKGRALPIASSAVGDEKIAGDWSHLFGGKEATISCQVRAARPGGKVQIEIFAGDIAPWHFETGIAFDHEWRAATAELRYDWSDEEATRAGWRKSATGFSWADTIQHVGKIVIVPTAAGALDAFDLDEVTVTGGAGR
ncbi:MAG: hypothetical protein K1X78_18850 [Verrucomicrobiaceae bacterium]|nr:hypothetical protein [Verrucomicrobiaceae bacterium]